MHALPRESSEQGPISVLAEMVQSCDLTELVISVKAIN